MFFEFSLGIIPSKGDLFESKGGQNTNFILVLFKNFQFDELLSIKEKKARGLSYFCEEKQPHHLHMFDKKSHKETKCLAQNEVTSVEIWCYFLF